MTCQGGPQEGRREEKEIKITFYFQSEVNDDGNVKAVYCYATDPDEIRAMDSETLDLLRKGWQ